MEAIFDLLNSYWSDEAILRRILVGLSAVTIFILGIGLSVLIMNWTNPLRRRIAIGGDDDAPPVKDKLMIRVSTALGPVASYILPQKELERDHATRRLAQAGYRSPQALQAYYAIKALLAVALPMLVVIGWRWFPEIETRSAFTYAMVASGVGLMGPSYVLRKLVARRIKSLRNAFPDALDLLVVCVEAGLGLAAAIQRVADELCATSLTGPACRISGVLSDCWCRRCASAPASVTHCVSTQMNSVTSACKEPRSRRQRWARC